MLVRVFPTAERMAEQLAIDLVRTIRRVPGTVLGLPTGRTPIPLYRELVRIHRLGRVSFARATTFNLDEFVGVARRDPGSYHSFMRRHFFDYVDVRAERVHFLNGRAADLDRECDRYERAIARCGGIDLQLLGLGANGHVGFNEPAPHLVARTHRTRLRAATRRANASLFGDRAAAVPAEALSMGMATILQARRIVLMATGAGKAACVERLVRGPLTTRLPASFLQLHPRAEVWLDADAASRL
jgi:glucosamine-6-phosphate deaminase